MKQTYHKIGIIGFGVRGQQIAKAIINDLPQYGEVVAAAEIRENPVLDIEISTRCPNLKIYRDYHELLADPEIDSVCIHTYEDTHLQITRDAINAGKAVLCDKPIVQTFAEAEEFYRFVTSRECKFQIGLNLPSFPVPMILKELIDRNVIGRIACIRGNCDVGAHFGRNIIMQKFTEVPRGSIITAKLTHDTDFMQYLLGTYAEEVWGKANNFQWHRNGAPAVTADNAVMAGVMNNGVLFTQTMTSTGSSYGRKFHIFGQTGELIADLHSEEIKMISTSGEEKIIPAKNMTRGTHCGADQRMLISFLDYVDSDDRNARWPERILSSIMIPMAALQNKLIKTGEWYRNIIQK